MPLYERERERVKSQIKTLLNINYVHHQRHQIWSILQVVSDTARWRSIDLGLYIYDELPKLGQAHLLI